MGIAKSTQFDRFDRSNFPSITNKKGYSNGNNNLLNDNFREKHLPEYPPLVVCRDYGCQTEEEGGICNPIFSQLQSHLNIQRYLTWKMLFLTLLVYLIICSIACLSHSFQTAMVYMNWVNFPFTPLSNLPLYGVSNSRMIQFYTDDGMLIRGWHMLPPGEITWNASRMKSYKSKEQYYNEQLYKARKIIIKLHGNAANRGVSRRIETMKQLATEFSAHVIAIDYRGFGDSSGIPSEIGTTKDMFGLWKWMENIFITEHQRELSLKGGSLPNLKLPPIFIYALSLGTGIAVDFIHHVTLQQNHGLHLSSIPAISTDVYIPLSNYTPPVSMYPAGLILLSPFSSIADAIHDYPYSMFFRLIPFVFNILSKFLIYQYPSIDNIQNIHCPILILHGTDDTTIPLHHSKRIIKSYEKSHKDTPECEDLSLFNSSLASCAAEDQFPPSPCSLRVKAVENGDLYSGMECIRTDNVTYSMPIISMVEIPHGTHENLYRSNEWFIVVPDFINKCVTLYYGDE